MRRFFTFTFAALMWLSIPTGCSHHAKWNRAQRQSMREALHEYRQAIYLNDLTDAEFALFADDVATSLEESFPTYNEFAKMSGMSDTVQYYVVAAIARNLNADARNMRHIFPYSQLVSCNILPAGLDRSQQQAFYNCFAAKVDREFSTMDEFVNALLEDANCPAQLTRMQRQCANDLFDWMVVIEQTEVVDL